MSMEDVCSCPTISVCVNVYKYISIYLKSEPSSNREIHVLIKNRLYLRHRVYCVMDKLLLREVTASLMQLYSLP